MRNLFKTFVLLLLICMIPTGTAKAARINRKKVTTEPGKIIVLSITSQTQNAKWSSSNKKVATVSKYGIVKAKKAGKCTITGTVGSKKYTCQVTVKKKTVNVEKISLSEVNLNMKIGETKKLSVTISPYNATKKKIVFSSENSLIASVDASGHVTGVSAGETNIYASCGNKQAVCRVIVNDIEENDKSKGEENNIKNIDILAEYTLPDGIGWFTRHFMVIKNNSNVTVDIETSSLAYNSFGTMVGVANSSIEALGSGCTTVIYEAFETSAEINHYETEISAIKSKYHESVIQDLSYTQINIDKGAIFQVTNNGTDSAQFVEGYALFFSGTKLVGYESTYFVDENSELKSGKTISKQLNSYDDFDRIEFYLHGKK